MILCLSVSSDLILSESLGLGFMSRFKRKYKIKCICSDTSYHRSNISYKVERLAIYFMYASQSFVNKLDLNMQFILYMLS